MSRAPDIEIYLRHCDRGRLEDWLCQLLQDLRCSKHQPPVYHYQASYQGHEIPIMLIEGAAGKAFCSLWFNSEHSPWASDLDCARQAFQALECEIRCAPGPWQEGDAPDQWWCINQQGEQLIEWRN